MKENKREYVSEKEYVLYLSKGSDDPDGFIVEDISLVSEKSGEKTTIEQKMGLKLSERISDATRFTSVEANRTAMDYHKITNRYPFKLKISNYKDLVF